MEDPVEEDRLLGTATDMRGRSVSFTTDRLAHIHIGHPEVRPEDVIKAIQIADKRTRKRGRNRHPDREMLWAKGPGPAANFVVVVEYDGRVGRVVTAYGSKKGPDPSALL